MISKTNTNILHKYNVETFNYGVGAGADLNTYISDQVTRDIGFEYCALKFNKQLRFIQEHGKHGQYKKPKAP